MRLPITIGMQECFVTASVGIALFPRDGSRRRRPARTPTSRCTGQVGGSQSSSVYRPSLVGKGRDQLELESALHKAIERDELELHYQPKIDVRGAKMVGAEALMRWRRHGCWSRRATSFRSPRNWLDHAAQRIGICERHARRGPGRTTSAPTIRSPSMPSLLFERTDLVEYTITRSRPRRAAPRDRARDHRNGPDEGPAERDPVAHRLNEIGVDISIDDFGTGYSSLAYLTTLPIQAQDRPQLRARPRHDAAELGGRHGDHRAGPFARPARDCRRRGKPPPMEVLHRLGCGIMQGFLFSKAQPPEV